MSTDHVPALLKAPYQRLAAQLTASAQWAIALAGICAVAALAGRFFHIEALSRVLPGWPEVMAATAGASLATAIAFALVLSTQSRARVAGVVTLAVVAVGVIVAMLLPGAQHLPGGALPPYPGSVLLLIVAAVALVSVPGPRPLVAVRLLAAASAALLFIATVGISFRLLLDLEPLVYISLPSLAVLMLLTYATATARADIWLMEQLATQRPGAVITRRLLPAVILLPLGMAWLELAGVRAHLLDHAFGAVLQTVVTIFGLGALLLWGGRQLDRLEAQRDGSEQALRSAYADLDRRVEERTEALERANAALHESLAEQERLTAAEQRLRHEAERANRAKDEFLAVVSHELRSPLNALRGWGFLLGSAKSPDAALIERATDAIKRNVDHQARLIDDLLDTSRIMSGKLNIERRPLNLVEVIRAALESVRQAAAAKRISLAFESERPVVMLEGDAARLNQIAVNLLSNAVKFTAEGGEVKATVQTAGDTARIVISDTGAGIDAEFLPRVFDRFSQADTSTTRRHGGLGIGLALVRHLSELHAGKVSVASEGLGKGSTFSVELPLTVVERRADAPAAPVPPAAETGGLAGVNICSLDDDPDARDVISLTLRQAGAEVRTVASGAELIAMLDQELPATRPDILLMDLAMPDEDGFTVLARVRDLERRKEMPAASAIPAIAVTAFTEVRRDRVLEQGFVDHVAKPIDPARLIATIRRAMRGQRERRNAGLAARAR